MYLLDLYRVTDDERYVRFVDKIVGFLDRIADRNDAGAGWCLSGRVSPTHGVKFHGTNLMTGQGGYITLFARLAQVHSGTVREVVQTPDFAVVGGPPGKRLLVVELGPGAERFRQVTRRLASYRGADWARLPDPDDREALIDLARRQQADALAIVIAPEVLDINRNRVVLDAICRIDDDTLPDASYGFLTGAEVAHTLAMLDGMALVERDGIKQVDIDYGMSPSFDELMIYPDRDNDYGWTSRSVYMPIRDPETCPDVRQYIAEALAAGERAGVVGVGGNGDPMRIWLFDDQRNMDSDLHWPFDPDRILRDYADEEMPCIGASDFVDWDIASTVLWFSTCHAGVTRNAIVGGDIVSTFGAVEDRAVAFYDLEPEESLCLTLLARGPSAYLAPIGPNHGWLASVEQHRAMSQLLSVGEAIRRNHVDIALSYRDHEDGFIPFTTQRAGRHEAMPDVPGSVMREGVLNRILFGDPTFEPFASTGEPWPDLVVQSREPSRRRWTATIRVANASTLEYWDPYIGRDESLSERLTAYVDLPAEIVESGIDSIKAQIDSPDDTGTFTSGVWVLEQRRAQGPRLWLKLNAASPEDEDPHPLWAEDIEITITVTPAGSERTARTDGVIEGGTE